MLMPAALSRRCTRGDGHVYAMRAASIRSSGSTCGLGWAGSLLLGGASASALAGAVA